MGGRGSGSNMTRSSSATSAGSSSVEGWLYSDIKGGAYGVSNEAVDKYNALEKERARIAPLSRRERTAEENRFMDEEFNREITKASNRIITEMDDSRIEKYADTQIKWQIEHPGNVTRSDVRDFLHEMSEVKKNGQPTKRALRESEFMVRYVIGVNSKNGGMGLQMGDYNYISQNNKDRITMAVFKAASKYRSRFD